MSHIGKWSHWQLAGLGISRMKPGCTRLSSPSPHHLSQTSHVFLMFAWRHMDSWATWEYISQFVLSSLILPLSHLSYPRSPWTCLSLLLCTVGSFSEHLDQINGRSECVDSTDNSSKPSSEPASHMARQRLESTEKKKISGKVTKSLSASALSLMIPGGRETSTRMKLCDFVHVSPLPQFGMLIEIQDC